MIDRNLDPIRLGEATDWGEILQALMFTYLAKYNVGGPDVNTTQAYRRAWGVTDMQFFARTDSELGFCVAKIPYSWGNHIIVAVEGTYSAGQLWSWRAGVFGSLQPPDQTGHVWGNEVTRSNSIWTRLMASSWFTGLALAPTAYITFTGHSQGASMAAILAGRFRATQGNRGVVARLFGSPRFPTQRYIDNYSTRIQMSSIHLQRDPVCLIPNDGFANDFSGGLTVPPFWNTPFVLFPGTWIDHYGHQSNAELLERGWSAADAFISMLGTGDPNTHPNYLPYHYMYTYRLAAMNIAHRAGGLLKLRVNYLEHPDENQWQVKFTPGTPYDSSWFVLQSPAPSAFGELEPEQVRLHNAGVPQTAITPAIDVQTIRVEGDDGWGTVDPITSMRRRRLQHNPGVVAP